MSTTVLHIDYETFSAQDLLEVGAYRYACDHTAEILCLAIALGDEEPRILLPPTTLARLGLEQDPVAVEWANLLASLSVEVYAHNAGFEIAVTKYRLLADLGFTPPGLKQWRCTAAMARRAALPSGLEHLAEVLGLRNKKDPRGSALLDVFSKPQTKGKRKGQRIMPWEEPQKFGELVEYCLQDVRVEQEAHQTLRDFELKGAALRTWQLDCQINDRGVPINVSALRNAKIIKDQALSEIGAEFRAITGLNFTQRDKVLRWLIARGYPETDMQAVSVARALEDVSWPVAADGEDSPERTIHALQLKADLSYSAAGKIDTMLECDCGDGLVRGTLLYYGAGPGRWAGRLIQPQNLKRPTFSDTFSAYAALCEGSIKTLDDMRLLFGTPLDVLASCIRHFIQLPDGQQIYDADYAAVEARIVCWLAGQTDALDRFRKYDATGSKEFDSYVRMAATIFNKAWQDVTKDERWLGKQTVLGCGFQMWVDKFLDQCLQKAEQYGIKGISVDYDLAKLAVVGFREDYDKVKDLWYAADRAAKNAILHPGKIFNAGAKLRFCVVTSGGVPFLVMKLPAGRSIVYPWPQLEADPKKPGEVKITFFGKLPMKSIWGRISTYGGKLVENATQGTAADFMAHGACTAVDRGFDVITLIHDQALGADDTRPVEEFCAALESLPPWAQDFPLKAEGKLVPYYLKL